MTNAITLVGTIGTDVFSTANTTATLVPVTLGNCMYVVTRCKSQTVGIASMSGGGCANWDHVGTFSFASGGGSAETIDLWVGYVTTTGSATLTLTGTASLAAISVSTVWQEFTVSGVVANTVWVAESASSLTNVASTNITYPTLTPTGTNRLYLGFAEPNGTPNTTGATAGYTAQVDINAVADRGQLITNPTLTSGVAASPIGTQTTSATSITCAVLLVATLPDTTATTNLNIGAAGGKNHFKLQTAFLNYAVDDEPTQAQLVAGWNTDPQFVAQADGSVELAVAAGAPTTGNTTYPRSELREVLPDGTTLMAFDANTGVHWIRARIKIGSLGPNRPHATLFQMHDGVGGIGEIIQIATQVNGTTGFNELRLRLWDSTTNIPKLNVGCATGDVMDFWCYINAGYWAFYYQDLGTPIYDSVKYAADGFTNVFSGVAEYYFKIGCYPQTNTTYDAATAISSSYVSYLRHWHTGWTVADPVTLPKTAQFAPFFG